MGNISSLTKTGVIFGVVIFYVCLFFFLGLMGNGNAIVGTIPQQINGVIGVVNDTTIDFYPVTKLDCSVIYKGDFKQDSWLCNLQPDNGICIGHCSFKQHDDTQGWTFEKFQMNISELGWFNTLFLIPLIGLLIFMFATSSALYNVQ